MATDAHRPRIVIAVTDSCPVSALWKAATQSITDAEAEVLVLLIADERWHRAASLPFTCEVSRLGGGAVNFSRRRAAQVASEAVGQARRRVERLAAESNLALTFEVWPEAESPNLQSLTGGDASVLFASAFLTQQTVYASLEALNWPIELIDAQENHHESPRIL